jgi:hypothetical protein
MSSIPKCRNLSGVQQGNEHDDNVERSGFLSRLDEMEKLILSALIAMIALLISISIGSLILVFDLIEYAI